MESDESYKCYVIYCEPISYSFHLGTNLGERRIVNLFDYVVKGNYIYSRFESAKVCEHILWSSLKLNKYWAASSTARDQETPYVVLSWRLLWNSVVRFISLSVRIGCYTVVCTDWITTLTINWFKTIIIFTNTSCLELFHGLAFESMCLLRLSHSMNACLEKGEIGLTFVIFFFQVRVYSNLYILNIGNIKIFFI